MHCTTISKTEFLCETLQGIRAHGITYCVIRFLRVTICKKGYIQTWPNSVQMSKNIRFRYTYVVHCIRTRSPLRKKDPKNACKIDVIRKRHFNWSYASQFHLIIAIENVKACSMDLNVPNENEWMKISFTIAYGNFLQGIFWHVLKCGTISIFTAALIACVVSSHCLYFVCVLPFTLGKKWVYRDLRQYSVRYLVRFLEWICEALKLNRDHSNTTNPLCIHFSFVYTLFSSNAAYHFSALPTAHNICSALQLLTIWHLL